MTDAKKLIDAEYEKSMKELSEATTDEETNRALKKVELLHKQMMSEADAKNGRTERIVKTVYDWAALLIPLGVSSFWMGAGMRFEETGSFTSRAFSWVANNMRLFRKG